MSTGDDPFGLASFGVAVGASGVGISAAQIIGHSLSLHAGKQAEKRCRSQFEEEEPDQDFPPQPPPVVTTFPGPEP